MPATIPTQRVDFSSGGTRCAACLTLPPGNALHPAVVLVHGFGATMVTIAGAEQGWNSTVPAGAHFENRVAAADVLGHVGAAACRQDHRAAIGMRLRP